MEKEKFSGKLGTLEDYLRGLINVTKIGEDRMYSIRFPMYRKPQHYFMDPIMQELYLVREEDGTVYLRDDGETYRELDRIFELSEQDVQKNLNAILKEFGCVKIGKTIAIECDSPEDIDVKLSYLIQAISFMLNMKIFYV